MVFTFCKIKVTLLCINFDFFYFSVNSGIFKINSEACLKVDAHLSSKACKKVEECSRSLQPVLEVVKLPRLQVWPKGWESSGPTDACIGLYFFPSNSRCVCQHCIIIFFFSLMQL